MTSGVSIVGWSKVNKSEDRTARSLSSGGIAYASGLRAMNRFDQKKRTELVGLPTNPYCTTWVSCYGRGSLGM